MQSFNLIWSIQKTFKLLLLLLSLLLLDILSRFKIFYKFYIAIATELTYFS